LGAFFKLVQMAPTSLVREQSDVEEVNGQNTSKASDIEVRKIIGRIARVEENSAD
jgi:hypothetical protein